ncbi:hypothetical protein V1478_018536 [Vespula squamosa]|uniref:Uncharacterized protein n=1 Tax=Vespula squamosa TaxID=30214 RepID=A0ABD1ZVH9_VESSQ
MSKIKPSQIKKHAIDQSWQEIYMHLYNYSQTSNYWKKKIHFYKLFKFAISQVHTRGHVKIYSKKQIEHPVNVLSLFKYNSRDIKIK